MSLYQPRSIWPRVVCSLAALLSVLFAAGCETSSVAPAKPLNWQKRSLPITVQSFVDRFSLDDSETVWLCKSTGLTMQVWVSNDQAQHWQRASDVKVAHNYYSCAVTPDAVDPKTAIITAFYSSDLNTPNTWVITHDGGKTW